jgi:hypothetical protein
MNWWLIIAIECHTPGCDNVLTPEGVKFLDEINTMVEDDPTWKQVCLLDEKGDCAHDNAVGGVTSKGSFVDVLKLGLGDDISEITQFAIDFALFGLAN